MSILNENTDQDLDRKSVKELQALATQQNTRPIKQSRKKSLSRGAQLHLIDILSRWSGAGLGAIAGVTVYLCMTIGRAFPLRAAVWCLVVLLALYSARKLRKDFRVGGKMTAHPFRWRANYTSSLSVLGAAFGAGAYLLVPGTGTGADNLLIYSLLLSTTIFAAIFHSAHAFSAAALATPSIAFIVAGAWQGLNISLALSGLIAFCSAGLLSVYLAAQAAQSKAKSQFPRSTFIRRDLRTYPENQAHATPLPQKSDGTATAV